MVSSVAHILGHAVSHVAPAQGGGVFHSASWDLFYPFVVEIFGAFHLVLDRFFRSSTALCVERRPYPPVSVVTAFLRQRVSVVLQRAQAFTIQRRAEAVGFRTSKHVPLFDLPLTFTTDLYQALS
ncbi:unnamed protein product [Calypogeia fissa]